jgi:hypothetical protein
VGNHKKRNRVHLNARIQAQQWIALTYTQCIGCACVEFLVSSKNVFDMLWGAFELGGKPCSSGEFRKAYCLHAIVLSGHCAFLHGSDLGALAALA